MVHLGSSVSVSSPEGIDLAVVVGFGRRVVVPSVPRLGHKPPDPGPLAQQRPRSRWSELELVIGDLRETDKALAAQRTRAANQRQICRSCQSCHTDVVKVM